jgi:hypothetical protein
MRRAGIVLAILFALGELVTWDSRSSLPWTLGLIINVGFAAAASALAFAASRHFDRGETARRVWQLIAFMALADCGVLISFTLPRIIGSFEGAVTLTLLTSVLTALSRGLLLPLALWMVVRIYRGIGLGFHLERWDYLPMVAFAGMGILSLALVGSVARSQVFSGDPGLVRFLRLIGLLLLPALVLSSVFGVMTWRYAKQMGGGLVAKAWQAILLCTVLWLARFAFLGVLTQWFGSDVNDRPLLIEMISFWSVLASECALFLGASCQYEACAGAVEMDHGEFEA